jgi:ribosome maturation factor RimP
VDDCARVSEQVSGVLDVEDPIHGHYTLEVSSPGLDRPLFEPSHYQRFAGRRARLQLRRPLLERPGMRLTGTLMGIKGNALVVEVDGQHLAIPVADIDKARLVPET